MTMMYMYMNMYTYMYRTCTLQSDSYIRLQFELFAHEIQIQYIYKYLATTYHQSVLEHCN